MVHVRKCPCLHGRGKPSTEFYKDGKPQIYCYGWKDEMTDEPIDCCKSCKDFAMGKQVEIDFNECKREKQRDIFDKRRGRNDKTFLQTLLSKHGQN